LVIDDALLIFPDSGHGFSLDSGSRLHRALIGDGDSDRLQLEIDSMNLTHLSCAEAV
jgi:hypothetical protein